MWFGSSVHHMSFTGELSGDDNVTLYDTWKTGCIAPITKLAGYSGMFKTKAQIESPTSISSQPIQGFKQIDDWIGIQTNKWNKHIMEIFASNSLWTGRWSNRGSFLRGKVPKLHCLRQLHSAPIAPQESSQFRSRSKPDGM